MSRIVPNKGRIIIKEIDRSNTKTDAGILMPGQLMQAESLAYGEVIVHNKSDEAEREYTAGEKVFYSRYSATMVRDSKGNSFNVVSDLDVMAVEENDTESV